MRGTSGKVSFFMGSGAYFIWAYCFDSGTSMSTTNIRMSVAPLAVACSH